MDCQNAFAALHPQMFKLQDAVAWFQEESLVWFQKDNRILMDIAKKAALATFNLTMF